MNIKRAKNEIKDAIEAYLLKDEYGNYLIPEIRQRPILLMGPPGIGKTQIMQEKQKSTWFPIRLHIIPDKVQLVFRLLKKKSMITKHILLRNIR